MTQAEDKDKQDHSMGENNQSQTDSHHDADANAEPNKQAENMHQEQINHQHEGHGEEGQDFSALSKTALIKALEKLIQSESPVKVKNQVEDIKSEFYKKHKAGIEEKKEAYIQSGGREEDFVPPRDEEEQVFKDLLAKYKKHKAEENKKIEKEREINLSQKQEVIDGIKKLIEGTESLNKTFEEFRALQKKWRESGPPPSQEARNLWNTYNHYVEQFYDYININKELRDLDFKKNQEEKTALCEKAEELTQKEKVVEAFHELQKLHDQWRNTGPVPKDQREQLWERFKAATTIINKKHQDYFQRLKEEQEANLQKKEELAEKVETLSQEELNTHQEWKIKTKELLEIQEEWKKIGRAPKKQNGKVYFRLKKATDHFFKRKREFYNANKEILKKNLARKEELCETAEQLKDSDDLEHATKKIKELQQIWKKAGPVPAKASHKLWKRFRSACDEFFQKKAEYHKKLVSQYDDNLKEKEALVEEIQKYESSGDQDQDKKAIDDFEKKWDAIGYVPGKDKNRIQKKYKQAIGGVLEKLNIDQKEKEVLQYKNKLIGLNTTPQPEKKLRYERDKLLNQYKKLENDIKVLENNIGFFNHSSKNADKMIAQFNQQIEEAREKMRMLKEKIDTLDQFDN